MLLTGSLLAVLSGVANSAAAALQKREAVEVGTAKHSFRLLAALVRRPWWLLTIVLSVMAWVAQAAALALAPVAAVAPLMSLGRGGLLVAGVRWLGERFSVLEVVGVALVTAGGAAAALSTPGVVTLQPLAPVALVAVGGGGLVLAWAVARRKSGVAFGVATGILYAVTGIYTKEVGDAVARNGILAITSPVAIAEIAAMVVLATIGQMYTQSGLQRANAASVSAATAMLSMNGLIAAGFALYHQHYPTGAAGVVLGLSLAASVVGTGMLSGPAAHIAEAEAERLAKSWDHGGPGAGASGAGKGRGAAGLAPSGGRRDMGRAGAGDTARRRAPGGEISPGRRRTPKAHKAEGEP